MQQWQIPGLQLEIQDCDQEIDLINAKHSQYQSIIRLTNSSRLIPVADTQNKKGKSSSVCAAVACGKICSNAKDNITDRLSSPAFRYLHSRSRALRLVLKNSVMFKCS